jgi:hypothetical protein
MLMDEEPVGLPETCRDHTRNAATATMFFLHNEMNLGAVNAVTTGIRILIYSSGSPLDRVVNEYSRLHGSTLVIKPDKPYEGKIKSV